MDQRDAPQRRHKNLFPSQVYKEILVKVLALLSWQKLPSLLKINLNGLPSVGQELGAVIF